QIGPFEAREPAEGVVQGLGRKLWVQARHRIAEAPGQHHLAVIAPFGGRHVGRDVGAVGDFPTDSLEPGESRFFDDGFGEGPHGSIQCTTGCARNSSSAMPSPPTSSVRLGLKASAKAAMPAGISRARPLLTSMATS